MSQSPRALMVVTGATGFVGRALLASTQPGITALSLSDDHWRQRLRAMTMDGACVVHLAARVHEHSAVEASQYERDNVGKTRDLADAAAAGGARRFVFLSTIKVHGEETGERAFSAADVPSPLDAYARSKWLAEQALHECAARTGLEVVVVRAPLVVGPGARGNLASLLALADSPWPLPFAAIDNRRTMLGVNDLVELLRACAAHPAAPGRTFLAGAAQPLSTPRILATLRAARDRPARLFAVAPAHLETLAGLVGARLRISRLTRSLEVDSSKTTTILGWQARTPIEDALVAMARFGR